MFRPPEPANVLGPHDRAKVAQQATRRILFFRLQPKPQAKGDQRACYSPMMPGDHILNIIVFRWANRIQPTLGCFCSKQMLQVERLASGLSGMAGAAPEGHQAERPPWRSGRELTSQHLCLFGKSSSESGKLVPRQEFYSLQPEV